MRVSSLAQYLTTSQGLGSALERVQQTQQQVQPLSVRAIRQSNSVSRLLTLDTF